MRWIVDEDWPHQVVDLDQISPAGVPITVCFVAYDGPDGDDYDRAVLIAAAPDLLEALRDIVFNRNGIQHWFNLDKARAAIAKAEGK